MRRSLFNRIRLGVMHFDDYFISKPDAVGMYGFSSYQKCTAAIRMLAYGVAGDLVDEYVRMSESTCLEAMYKFCRAVMQVFGPAYLRPGTQCCGHDPALVYQRDQRLPWDDWEHRLYALGVE